MLAGWPWGVVRGFTLGDDGRAREHGEELSGLHFDLGRWRVVETRSIDGGWSGQIKGITIV